MSPPSATARTGRTRSAAADVTVAAVAGLLSGALGAYSYYDPLLRPLAHTLGLWLIVTIALTAGRPPRAAMLRATTGLLAAVLAFYLGKKVMYAIRDPGMPYPINVTEVAIWVVLAVVAGVAFGWALHRIGQPGWPGAAAAATAAGLLLGDALHRGYFYRGDIPVAATVAVLGLVLLTILVRMQDGQQLRRTVLLALPATAVAVLLVSTPDVIEQLVFVGL